MKPPASAKAVPAKSPQAFRTISEVAEALDVPAHVLRFWETRFSQIRPVKRAGGRRLYRPEHVALIAGIRALLHDDGLTIKGVQKMLRTDGTRAVVARGRTGAALRVAEVPRDAVERLARLRARLDAPATEPPPPTGLRPERRARLAAHRARLAAVLARLERTQPETSPSRDTAARDALREPARPASDAPPTGRSAAW